MVLLTSLIAGAALLQTGQKPQITVTTESYLGWSGSIRITNGRFSLVVAPQVGRIVYAGYDKESKNLLWVNPSLQGAVPNQGKGDYQNFGGDKVWVSPQSLWTWPPDPDLDGSPWTATPTDDGVTITSPISKKNGVQITRDISLGGGGSVRIRNTMTNVGDKAVELGVWEVTQVDSPNIIAMDAKPTTAMPNGYVGLQDSVIDNTFQRYDNVKQVLFIQRDPSKGRKFGAGSPEGAIEATLGTGSSLYTFKINSNYEPTATYPDNGSAMEVFTSNDPLSYAELEMLSPVRKLRPNQKISLPVRWQIKRVKE